MDSHPGLTDLFLTLAKREYLLAQSLTPEDIQAEAERLLRELQAQDASNSPKIKCGSCRGRGCSPAISCFPFSLVRLYF